MNILFLSEGDAETRDAWSGTAKSVVDWLRLAGHTVRTGDVELYGMRKWLAAARTFSPRRDGWRVQYRLGPVGFEARSQRAARHIASRGAETEVIFQIGATFEPRGHGAIPYVLYCDSNIRMAERGAASGHTHAAHLTDTELDAVRSREATVYQGAAAILTISNHLRASFVEDFGIRPECVRTVHAGPNLENGLGIPTTIPARDGGPPTVLFVGRQFERKGGDVLLRAFRLVHERFPDAELLIVGPPARLPTEPGVRWLGFLSGDDPAQREALAAVYRSARVFCLPTRFEPFGIVFLEAMHWGLPCVGTDTGAIPEMILDGATGYTVASDDVSALADRLCRLLGDRRLAATMGEAGRARVLSDFTWPAVVARMTDMLAAVVLRRRTTPGG